MVPGHPHDIVVTGDDPQGVLLVPVDGVFFSEAAIIGIGISDSVLREHIIVDHSNSHNPCLPLNNFSQSYAPDQTHAFDGNLLPRQVIAGRRTPWPHRPGRRVWSPPRAPADWRSWPGHQ